MENYEIVKIDECSWRIEDTGVRFFLLTGGERALLIDSGMRVSNARDIAAGLTDLPISLLNTHADRDHIGSNEQFESFYMHPAEESIYRRSGKSGDIVPVVEGDCIDLGNRELKIIELPGHTPGSIGVLDVKKRVFISGDPIQRHGRIFMFGDHRNMKDYIRSLDGLRAYKDMIDEIWPSHGDIPISTDIIDELLNGAKNIINGRIPGSPTEIFGNGVVEYDLGFSTVLCDN